MKKTKKPFLPEKEKGSNHNFTLIFAFAAQIQLVA
jgi:hypothetical protein